MYVKHRKLKKKEQEGKRGRGDTGKVPVFGILKRGGKVYTQAIENTKSNTLMPNY